MPSKELLLSGLGLEPRWLLNRLQTTFLSEYQNFQKNQDKENTAVEGSKVKEENLEVARGKCKRGSWKIALCFTGEKSKEGHICLKQSK